MTQTTATCISAYQPVWQRSPAGRLSVSARSSRMSITIFDDHAGVIDITWAAYSPRGWLFAVLWPACHLLIGVVPAGRCGRAPSVAPANNGRAVGNSADTGSPDFGSSDGADRHGSCAPGPQNRQAIGHEAAVSDGFIISLFEDDDKLAAAVNCSFRLFSSGN
jgi:hypothetical protein